MGKIANPISGDVEVSLEGARDAIEMLDMLRRRTVGNLNRDESRFLEHVLYQLRMNYVDVAGEAAAGPEDETASADQEGEGPGDDSDGGSDGRGDEDE